MATGTGPIRLASDRLALEVDVELGAKITKLQNMATGREWLLQLPATADPGRRPGYGEHMTAFPLGGWDEMFPTVDECDYQGEYPHLPDHGELWARPWTVRELTPNSLECDIGGVAFPYRLRRRIEIDESRVVLDYSATNEGREELDTLWCPHPQLVAEPGTRVFFPDHVTELDTVLYDGPSDFTPLSVEREGLEVGTLAPPGYGMMLYADPGTRLDTVTVRDRGGEWITFSWDSGTVPYFAMWVDNGRYAPQTVVCPEPMTGYYDSLQRAQQLGLVQHIGPGETARWSLRVTVGAA
jgi:galactose mutarotase-like enzyme